MALCICAVHLSACAARSYQYDDSDIVTLTQRAEAQTYRNVTVSATVPSAAEAENIFGLPLYDKGVQPVWLEIVNNSPVVVRLAPVGIDNDYFSPLEVSYVSRRGYSKEARAAMDQRFHESGIERWIQPGATESGFVFTHLVKGTKSFNVDLFGGGDSHHYTFFVDVPGYVPSHSEVNFAELYDENERRMVNQSGLRQYLESLPCCSSNAAGSGTGQLLNVALIGNGKEILQALLRANWYEVSADDVRESNSQPYFLFGRKPDAVLRIQRGNSTDRNEMLLWMAPVRADDKAVWVGHITNFVGKRRYIQQVLELANRSPDVDDARNFLLQNLWYAQSLRQYAWMDSEIRVPVDNPRTDFNGESWFTNGVRLVAWLSAEPVSLTSTRLIPWDKQVRIQ